MRPNSSRPRQSLSANNRSPFVAKPKTNRRNWLATISNGLILVGILVALGWSLMVKSPPSVAASSYVYHSAKSYSAFTAGQMTALKNNNKITFDEKTIVASLQRQFPEIANASVELPLFSQKPTFHLAVASPAFFISDGSTSYILDSAGVAVGKNTDFPQIKNLLVIADQSGFKLQSGHAALGTSAISFINILVAQAKHSKVPIASLTLPSGGQELDLRTTDQPYFVKFYLTGDALTQTGQWLAARHNFSTNHTAPSSYLDVRVAGKIFYK